MSDIIVRLKDLYQKAETLFGEKATETWMSTPNDYFSGISPLDKVMLGEGEAVILLLKERIGEYEDSP